MVAVKLLSSRISKSSQTLASPDPLQTSRPTRIRTCSPLDWPWIRHFISSGRKRIFDWQSSRKKLNKYLLFENNFWRAIIVRCSLLVNCFNETSVWKRGTRFPVPQPYRPWSPKRSWLLLSRATILFGDKRKVSNKNELTIFFWGDTSNPIRKKRNSH